MKFIGTETCTIPNVDNPNDRGCVSCGVRALASRDVYVVDARDRYWCLDCGMKALGNVRRRVDERSEPEGTYRWRFDICPSCESDKITHETHDEDFVYGSGDDAVTLTAHAVTFGVCSVCKFNWTDSDAELKRTDAICRHLQRALSATRSVLGVLRDEFEELSHGVPGDRRKTFRELTESANLLIGPSRLGALPPTHHIAWADVAICRFVPYSQKHWPPSQTATAIHKVLPRSGREKFASLLMVAKLDTITCAACKEALPEFLDKFDALMADKYSDVSYGDGETL